MIIGRVDDYGRALVSLTLFDPGASTTMTFDGWIDTGFTGALMLTAPQITALNLAKSSVVSGTLADGSQVVFDTYSCHIEWFGRRIPIEALETGGRFALIGIPLVQDCTLAIDYPARTVAISALSGLPSFP